MIKLHTTNLGNNILIPKIEFWDLIKKFKKIKSEKISIIEEDFFLDLRKHSESSFNKLWDNNEDEVWNEYL